MVGCAMLMLGIVLLGGWLRWRRRLTDTPLFLLLCQIATPIGFVAIIAGWAVTEVRRQPWTVYGLLRTAASVSPSLTGRDVAISLLAYMAVYLFMYPTGLFLMLRIVRAGPMPVAEGDATIEAGRPQAPVLAGAGVSGGANHEPGSRLRADLDADPRRRRILLRAARRLRPRRRHPLWLRTEHGRAQHHHEFDRADLGRQ
jgi:hypothetical protein